MRDTFSVPPATDAAPGELRVLIPFTDPVIVGRFVYHCHTADHEDKGMMGIVEVVARITTFKLGEAMHAAPGIIEPNAATHSSCAIALEARNLSRAVAGKMLVNDITVQVRQGEVLAVGRSERVGEIVLPAAGQSPR